MIDDYDLTFCGGSSSQRVRVLIFYGVELGKDTRGLLSEFDPYLIVYFDTHRISCSDNNEVLWVFETRSHWIKKKKNEIQIGRTNNCLDY